MSDSQTLAQIQTLLFHCINGHWTKRRRKNLIFFKCCSKKQLHYDYQIMILWSRIISFIFPHRLEINCKVILRIVSKNTINSLNFWSILRSKRLIICCQIKINWRSERQIKASNRLSHFIPNTMECQHPQISLEAMKVIMGSNLTNQSLSPTFRKVLISKQKMHDNSELQLAYKRMVKEIM